MKVTASLRAVARKNGSTYSQVLYRLGGQQTSTSFEGLATGTKFKRLVENFGAGARAPSTLGVDPEMTTVTVQEWCAHHIEHRALDRKWRRIKRDIHQRVPRLA